MPSLLAQGADVAMPWEDMFTKLAGKTPGALGIKSEAQAQSYLLQLKAMQDARPPNSDPNYDSAAAMNVGRIGQGTGTRPTK